MKLQNKETGKIGYLYEHSLMQDIIIVYDVKGIVGKYASLAELNEEWEDYEEPKEPKKYWYIYGSCVLENECDGVIEGLFKTTDNYFETKEEAEKAVEKLKAWKRLKDKGFRFNDWSGTKVGANISYTSEVYYEGWVDDMNLLFRGEE